MGLHVVIEGKVCKLRLNIPHARIMGLSSTRGAKEGRRGSKGEICSPAGIMVKHHLALGLLLLTLLHHHPLFRLRSLD